MKTRINDHEKTQPQKPQIPITEDGSNLEFGVRLRVWCLKGQLHRVDAPAIERADGSVEYSLHGDKVTEQDATDPSLVGKTSFTSQSTNLMDYYRTKQDKLMDFLLDLDLLLNGRIEPHVVIGERDVVLPKQFASK